MTLRGHTRWIAAVSRRPACQYLLWLSVLTPVALVLCMFSLQIVHVNFMLDGMPTYIAGKVWQRGFPEAVYCAPPAIPPHPEWLAELARHRLPLLKATYTYSPTYLALWSPLIRLVELRTFFWIFGTLGTAAALVIGYESMRIAGVRGVATRWLGGLIVATSVPAAMAYVFGQNITHTGALALWAFRCLANGQAHGARFPNTTSVVGLVLLQCVFAFKPWAVLLLGVFVAARQTKHLIVSSLCFLAVHVLIPALATPELLSGHLAVLRVYSQVALVAFNNHSLRALLHRLADPDWPGRAAYWDPVPQLDPSLGRIELAAVIAIAALFVAIAALRKPRFEIVGGAAMALLLLPLGIVWTYYLILQAPVLTVALLHAGSPLALRVAAGAVALWSVRGLWIHVPLLYIQEHAVLSALVIGAPLLLGGVVAVSLVWQRPPAAKPAPSPSSPNEAGAPASSPTIARPQSRPRTQHGRRDPNPDPARGARCPGSDIRHRPRNRPSQSCS